MLLVNQNNVVDAKSVNASLIALNKKIKQVEDKIAPSSKVVNNPNINIFDVIYPVKSLYWTEDVDFDPNKSFFGTWERVKGKFIYAANDNETIGTIGGSKKITTENLPIHNHSFTGSEHSHTFTPSGSVANHSHGLNGHTHGFTPSGTVANHSHGLNNHTHSFSHTHGYTPSGTVNSSATASDNKTSGMSGNATGSVKAGSEGLFNGRGTFTTSGNITLSGDTKWAGGDNAENGRPTTMTIDVSHTHNVYFKGTAGTTTSQSTSTTGSSSGNTTNTQPSFTGTNGTTGGSSGNTTNTQPSFTGTQQTIKATASGTIGNTGSGADYMPPYESAICWKRIA